jgi:hypothetical protein
MRELQTRENICALGADESVTINVSRKLLDKRKKENMVMSIINMVNMVSKDYSVSSVISSFPIDLCY